MSDQQRTVKQNASLHLWFRQAAEFLNDSGLDMKTVLAAKSVDVPWTEVTFKEIIWRPIQEAMLLVESTADVKTVDYPRVYDVLVRHFAQNLECTLPVWPDRFSQGKPPQDQTVDEWLDDYGPVQGETNEQR